MMLGTKVLDCHHGKDRGIKLKELNKKKKESGWVRASSFLLILFLCVESVTLILRFISTF